MVEGIFGYEPCLLNKKKEHISNHQTSALFSPGAVYVSQSLQFVSPVYVGDEIIGEVQAANIRAIKNKYLVKFKTKCSKYGDNLVIDGEAMAILPSLAMEQGQSC
ncbi:hypothetical protein U1Q18_021031 [Sarracenia purpurea var. burkii]